MRPALDATQDDAGLMQMVCRGQHSALETLYRRHGRRVLAYFRMHLRRDPARAEDLLQDLFANIWAKPHLYDASRTFTTWMFSCAHNLLRNEARHTQVRDRYHVADDTPPDTLYDETLPDISIVLDQEAFRHAVDEELQQVSHDHRSTFHLRFVEELSLAEIADILDVPVGTVKSRLHTTLRRLAQRLHNHASLG